MLKELLGDLWTEAIEGKLKGKIELVGSEPKVPKTRLDEVILERNNYKTQVDGLVLKVEEASKAVLGVDDLKIQLANVKSDHETFVKGIETEKVNTTRKNALIKYLKDDENVLSPELLVPFYDLETLTIADNKISGAKEKTESLKSQFPDQFGKKVTKTPDIITVFNDKSFKDLSSKEKLELKLSDPDGYQAARKAHLNR